MRKKLSTYYFSFKSSVQRKPMALVMIFLLMAVMVFCCGFTTRALLGAVEETLFDSLKMEVSTSVSDKEFGDAMLKLKDEGLWAYNSTGSIEYAFNKINVENSSGKITLTSGDLIRQISSVYAISDEHIRNKENVIVVNNYFLSHNVSKIGDEVTFSGTKYEIIGTIPDDQYSPDRYALIYMPYNVEIADYNVMNDRYGESGFYRVRCDVNNLARMLNNSDVEYLSDLGIKAKHYSPISPTVIQTLIFLILMLAITSINIWLVVSYWLKVNEKKFAVYKIVGANNSNIAISMLIENSVFIMLGIGAGLLFDWLIYSNMYLQNSVDKLLWAHYIILIISTAITALGVVAIKIFKRAKTKPIDRSMYN